MVLLPRSRAELAVANDCDKIITAFVVLIAVTNILIRFPMTKLLDAGPIDTEKRRD